MSLRTNPASGVTYSEAYKSDQFERPVDWRSVTLQVWYFEDNLGPQVKIVCPWGRYLSLHDAIGQALVIPRQEWDRMLGRP